jgi:N-acyl amino acid synthase of PEP-CTERM/exosortase system
MSTSKDYDFAPYFYARQILPNRDPTAFRLAQELRYKVYCEECGYLARADYPDGLEHDRFDEHSAHFCAFNMKQELVGYARLVSANKDGKFPFESYCATTPTVHARPPSTESAEISRMIVRQDYRRRRGDMINGLILPEEHDANRAERRSNSPQILLSIYRQMYQYSIANKITCWYAAMERPVARALSRIGSFTFHEIGPEQDYFGPVAPYIANLEEIESSVTSRNRAMLEWLKRVDP